METECQPAENPLLTSVEQPQHFARRNIHYIGACVIGMAAIVFTQYDKRQPEAVAIGKTVSLPESKESASARAEFEDLVSTLIDECSFNEALVFVNINMGNTENDSWETTVKKMNEACKTVSPKTRETICKIASLLKENPWLGRELLPSAHRKLASLSQCNPKKIGRTFMPTYEPNMSLEWHVKTVATEFLERQEKNKQL